MLYQEIRISTLLHPFLYITHTKKMSLIILTSIRKAIFTQNKCPLFFMINNCNLCRSAKIYLVNLSYQEKEKDRFTLEITCETSIHHNWLHILNRISRVGSVGSGQTPVFVSFGLSFFFNFIF